jgi:mRNA-degrading endonuclease toxin of MazEF toxin-antitoxin module
MSSTAPINPKPSQGEIWVVRLPTEPPDKGARYVVVVSSDAQNHHARARTVTVVPLTTTLSDSPCLRLEPGETGLSETSEISGNGISSVLRAALVSPKTPLRKLSRTTVCRIMKCVILSLGLFPKEIPD